MTIYVLKAAVLKFGPKSFVLCKKFPSSFRTPWPLGLIIEEVFILRSWMSYGFHTLGSHLLQFSYTRQFPSTLVPDIKNKRSLKVSCVVIFELYQTIITVKFKYKLNW